LHIKSKYILYEFLLILLFLTIHPITAAKESSIFNLGLRLWEKNTDSIWASYGELNWSTKGSSSDPLDFSWYNIISPSLAGSMQKLDFLASTGDGSIWEAEITVEISIIAAFVTEWWVSNPQNSSSSSAPNITPGFELWLIMTSLALVIVYQQKRRQ